VPYLRPDGKTQVTYEYHNGWPVALKAVLISTQHQEGVDRDTVIRPDLIDQVIRPMIPERFADDDFEIYVNPTGQFVRGGPFADAGLTGRKIIVDTYGGMGRHGGGAFSGKDPSKVDRSAAYAGRWVAKHVVASGAADRCEVQLAYAIGMAQPMSILVETFGTIARRAFGRLRPLRPRRLVGLGEPSQHRGGAAHGGVGRAEGPDDELGPVPVEVGVDEGLGQGGVVAVRGEGVFELDQRARGGAVRVEGGRGLDQRQRGPDHAEGGQQSQVHLRRHLTSSSLGQVPRTFVPAEAGFLGRQCPEQYTPRRRRPPRSPSRPRRPIYRP
jgi:hypothetical protein